MEDTAESLCISATGEERGRTPPQKDGRCTQVTWRELKCRQSEEGGAKQKCHYQNGLTTAVRHTEALYSAVDSMQVDEHSTKVSATERGYLNCILT